MKLEVGVLEVLGVGVGGVVVEGLGVDAVVGGVIGAWLQGGVLWGVTWFGLLLTIFIFRGGFTSILMSEGMLAGDGGLAVLPVGLVRGWGMEGDGEEDDLRGIR